MSDYEHGQSASDGDEVERVLEEKKQALKGRRGPKPGAKRASKNEDDEDSIEIREFDLNSMPPFSQKDEKNGVKIVVIGKPGTGKSTIIQDIVASKAHIATCAQIFSGTEDSNHYYSEKFAPCCVHNKLDMDAIKNFIVRQKLAKKFLPNAWAVQIIDDCTDDPSQLRDPIFQAYYKNGRHWNMIHILSLQYSLDILPSIRTNIDYTFILRETNQRNRKALHENYAGCIPSYQMFQDIMDTITEDYTALVINNRVQSNKIEDCVFWYKAKPDRLPPNWKFGHPVSWEFNAERLDPSSSDPLIV